MLPCPRCAAKSALDAGERYRLCTNVQAARVRKPARCPLYEQAGEANEFLCGNGAFSLLLPLDRITVHAHHRSYANNRSQPRGCDQASRTAGWFMTDVSTAAIGDKVRCDACP